MIQTGFRFTQFRDLLLSEGNVSASASLISQKLSNFKPEEVVTDNRGLHVHGETIVSRPLPQKRKRIYFNNDIPVQPLCIVQQTVCSDLTVSPIFRFVNQYTLHPFSNAFVRDVETLSQALGSGDNIYLLRLPHLCELHLRTIAFANLRGFKAVTFIAELVVHMIKLAKPVHQIAGYLGLIDSIFRGERLRLTPAHIVIAAPGTGKTTTNQLYSLGYLDTDYLNVGILDKDPSIISRLCSSGQAIMTNRWEWKQWSGLKFAVMPENLVANLESKNIFNSNYKRMASDAIRLLKFKKIYGPGTKPRVRYDQEKWIEAYSDIGTCIPTYVGTMEDGLIYHFLNLFAGK